MELPEIKKKKKKIFIRNMLVVVVAVVLLILLFIVSMNAGYIKLSPGDTLRTLFGGGTTKENLILFDFRLPRIVLAILVGAGLSLSGCLIQGVAKNPLADPGILGINAGAGLFIVLWVIFLGASTFSTVMLMPFGALLGAGFAAFLIYILAYKRGQGLAPVRLILMGVGIQSGITALMTVLVVKLDDTQFNFVATWQAGSIWGSNWRFVLSLLPWLLLLVPYLLKKAHVLDLLGLGDEVASSLGVSVEKEKVKLLGVAVALAASCVAVSGNIGFVGLIGPHLARELVGARHKVLLPVCALAGGVLVLLGDTIGRVIIQPQEIPAGIVTAIIGAPYFLYLLAKNRK